MASLRFSRLTLNGASEHITFNDQFVTSNMVDFRAPGQGNSPVKHPHKVCTQLRCSLPHSLNHAYAREQNTTNRSLAVGHSNVGPQHFTTMSKASYVDAENKPKAVTRHTPVFKEALDVSHIFEGEEQPDIYETTHHALGNDTAAIQRRGNPR